MFETTDPSRQNDSYDVFLSYSRRDVAFARLLEKALDDDTPDLAERRLRVFRDEGEITGNEYYRSIERALRHSRKLILIASPDAYKSRFVNDELRDFIRMKGARNVLVILLRGLPNNECQAEQESEKAFPEILREVMRMPLAVDYRGFDQGAEKLISGRQEHNWRRILDHILREEPFTWDIFISYAAGDASFATLLEKELEKYTPPDEIAPRHNLPARRLRVFRDLDDATAEDTDKIRQALESSRQVFLLCSPAAHQDARVRQQVTTFAGLHGAENIIPILLSGEPGPDSARNAFPAELLQWIPEPSWTDYRGFRERKDKINRGAFSGHWATMLATHFQVRREELEQRERKRRAKARRLVAGVTVTVILLLAAALVLALISRYQMSQARVAEARQLERAEYGLYVVRGLLTQNAMEQHDYIRALELLEASVPAPGTPAEKDVRGFDWFYRWSELHNEIQTLKGHERKVNSVAFSPDGNMLASGSDDGTIRVWDVSSGQEKEIRKIHSGSVNSVAFSPDGQMLASGGYQTIKIWDMVNGGERASLNGHEDQVRSVLFSSDGRTLVSESDDLTLRLWDASSGQEKNRLLGKPTGHRNPEQKADSDWKETLGEAVGKAISNALSEKLLETGSVWMSGDGRLLASASFSGKVKLWDIASGREKQRLKNHAERNFSFETMDKLPAADLAISAAFSPDGRILASGRMNGEVIFWDLARGQKVGTIKNTNTRPVTLRFSPDGGTLACGNHNGAIQLWRVQDGQELGTLKGHAGAIQSVSFSPDDNLLASGSEDGTVKLWDWKGIRRYWAESKKQRTGNPQLFSTSRLSDGQIQMQGIYGENILLRPMESTQEPLNLDELKMGTVRSISFSPDNQLLAIAFSEGLICAVPWVTSNRQRVYAGYHNGDLRAVAFSPDSRTLASGSSNGTVKLWDMVSGKERSRLAAHTKPVVALSFSPDGRMLATGGEDCVIRLWDARTGHEVSAPVKCPYSDQISFSFSPDWTLVAEKHSSGYVELRGLQDGANKTGVWMRDSDSHRGSINTMVFSPDGRTLAGGGDDGAVRLWEWESGQEIVTLKGHSQHVQTLSFSPDGRTLASGDTDGQVKLWDVKNRQEILTLASHNGSVDALSFSPDGRGLASGGSMGWGGNNGFPPFRLWSGVSDAQVARHCVRCGK